MESIELRFFNAEVYAKPGDYFPLNIKFKIIFVNVMWCMENTEDYDMENWRIFRINGYVQFGKLWNFSL